MAIRIRAAETDGKGNFFEVALDSFIGSANKQSKNDNLFSFHSVGNGKANYVDSLGFDLSVEECLLGKSVKEFEDFVGNVERGKPCFLYYETDTYLTDCNQNNSGTMYFDGKAFYYTVFDCGEYYSDIQVPFCEKHLSDMKEIITKMHQYEQAPDTEKVRNIRL